MELATSSTGPAFVMQASLVLTAALHPLRRRVWLTAAIADCVLLVFVIAERASLVEIAHVKSVWTSV
jgi:hypothetical protein